MRLQPSRSDRRRARNDGSVAIQLAAMPAYCAPWPLNMKTHDRSADVLETRSAARSG